MTVAARQQYGTAAVRKNISRSKLGKLSSEDDKKTWTKLETSQYGKKKVFFVLREFYSCYYRRRSWSLYLSLPSLCFFFTPFGIFRASIIILPFLLLSNAGVWKKKDKKGKKPSVFFAFTYSQNRHFDNRQLGKGTHLFCVISEVSPVPYLITPLLCTANCYECVSKVFFAIRVCDED